MFVLAVKELASIIFRGNWFLRAFFS